MITTNERHSRINALLDANADSDFHSIAARLMLIYPAYSYADFSHFDFDSSEFSETQYNELHELLSPLFDHPNDAMISLRSTLALEFSLCPIHLIDYAICFDDETPECAQIRDAFPTHDT